MLDTISISSIKHHHLSLVLALKDNLIKGIIMSFFQIQKHRLLRKFTIKQSITHFVHIT